MGKHIHKVVSKDPVSQKGVCKNCGPVDFIIKDGRPKCINAHREQKGRQISDNIIPGVRARAARTKNPKKRNVNHHGLTSEEAKEFKQNKVCKICGTKENLVVDHCHSINIIRGVLCRNHNTGLGLFNDNVGYLSNAIQYLKDN